MAQYEIYPLGIKPYDKYRLVVETSDLNEILDRWAIFYRKLCFETNEVPFDNAELEINCLGSDATHYAQVEVDWYGTYGPDGHYLQDVDVGVWIE